MRTTLDLDEDVLLAAKELAKLTNRTMGQTVSDLARSSLVAGSSPALKLRDDAARPQEGSAPPQDSLSPAQQKRRDWLERFGVVPLPRREGPLVTNELVNRVRDEEGI